MMPVALTWTCHVCGDERADANISVAKHTNINGYGHRWDENVRYCNDRPECEKQAKLHGHTARHAVRTEGIALREARKARWWKARFFALAWGGLVAALFGAAFAVGLSIPI